MENYLKNRLERDYEGVYILFDKGIPVYVGESECVPARIKQHIAEGVKEFDDYRIYHTIGRKKLETDLIRLLQPKYNISENPAARVECHSIFFDRHKAVHDDLDRLIALKSQQHEPIPCFSSHLKEIFNMPNFKYDDVISTLKKYHAYLGVDERFNDDIFDLKMLLQCRDLIQADFDKLERIASGIYD